MTTATRNSTILRVATIGLIAGVFSGFFGVGGGIIMVPLMVIFLGADQRSASVTSLVAIIPTATVAATSYLSSGVVPWDQIGFGLVIAIGSSATAPLGTWALRSWNINAVRWIFIAVQFATAIVVFVTFPDRDSHLDWSASTVVALIALGAVMGFVSGLLGVGGGLIVVPALIVLFGVSDLTAKALSLIAMVPAAITGTMGSARAGVVDWRRGLSIGATAAIAAPFGAWLATLTPVEWAEPMLAAFVLYAAIQLTLRALRAQGTR